MADSSDDVIRSVDPKTGRVTARHTNLTKDYARAFGTNGKGGRQRAQALLDAADAQTSDDLDTLHSRQHSDNSNDY